MKSKQILLLAGAFSIILAVGLSQKLSVKLNGTLSVHTTTAAAALTGTVSISPSPVPAGQTISITVIDADLIASSNVNVTVVNLTTGESESVSLPVATASTGTFIGTLATSNAVGAGTVNSGNMNVQSGQSLQVTYIDALNASGLISNVIQTVTVGAATSIPSQVTGLLPTFLNSSSVRLNWDNSTFTGVSGYKVYFGTTSRSSAAFTRYSGSSREGSSPVKTTGNTTSLSKLPAATLPASMPAVSNLALSPFSQGLTATWNPVAGATGYKIYYSTTSFDTVPPPVNPVSISVTGTSYKLTGLTNGTTYFVAVTAIAQPSYYFAVTAAIDPSLTTSTPGTANESNYSAEVTQNMSSEGTPTVESSAITLQSAIPEEIVAYPNLKNEGCFIATAAYGFYSAPQVQVLRDFRDRYLLTNTPGRAFVAWYYRYGPHGAHFLNQHPLLKPVVRLGLLPLVAVALFLISTSAAVKIAAMLGVILCSAYVVRKKTLLSCGGVQ